MAALANSGVPTVNPALNVKQQLALAILGGQGTATQMLRERRKHMVAASQPKGMCVRMCLGHHFIRVWVCVCVCGVAGGGWVGLVLLLSLGPSACLCFGNCSCLPYVFMGVFPETHLYTAPPSVLTSFWKMF